MLKLTDELIKDQIKAFLNGGGSIDSVDTVTGEEAKRRNAEMHKNRFLSKDRKRTKNITFKSKG
ncbi:MAG: hypothetical protein P8P29_03280 [Flavobacteriaceae bacterium]|nr:hypothetical protein [Flavobacteriaceae bacterium]